VIKSLTLRQFKKHENLHVDFTEGLNLITGPNYAGKSTILYGILFALGGATSAPGTLQRNGTNTGFHVELSFLLGDDPYRVVRKKTGAYLYAGADLIASGTSPVNEKVEELLGLGSMKRFRQLKYAEQKKAHALLTAGATELHKILDELTGVWQVNEALERLKEVVSAAAGGLEVLVPVDTDHLEQEKDGVEAGLHRLEIEGNALATQVDGLREALVERSTKLKEQDAVAKEHGRLLKQLTQLEAAVVPLEERESELLAKVEDPAAVQAKQARVDGLKAELGQWRDRLAKHAAAAKQRDRDLGRLKAAEVALQTATQALQNAEEATSAGGSVAEAEKAAEAALAALGELRDRLRDIDMREASFLKARKDSTCPTCKRPYGDDHAATLDEVDAQILRCQKERQEIGPLAADAEHASEVAKRHLKERHRLAKELALRTAEKGQAEKECQSASESLAGHTADLLTVEPPDIEALEKELAGLQSEIGRAITAADELEKVRQKLAGARQSLEELPPLPRYSSEEHAALRKAMLDVDADLHTKVTEQNRNAVARAAATEKLLSLQERIRSAESQNAAYQSLSARHATAKALQKYLKENRDRYASEIWDFFLASASQFVSDCTSGAISEIRRSDTGQFTYVEAGQEMVLKDASGAQEAILGLGIQSALADAAACPLDTLLVDEPTADMDAQHSLTAFAMLTAKGRQVIAVSHREMDASLCSNAITL